ncbi:hypothetical protein ABKV19_000358, partial [Rosa sericea]
IVHAVSEVEMTDLGVTSSDGEQRSTGDFPRTVGPDIRGGAGLSGPGIPAIHLPSDGNHPPDDSNPPADSNLSSVPVELTATRSWLRLQLNSQIENIVGHKPRGLVPKLKWAFVTSCVFGVFLDPFFFYIPIVRSNKSCIGQHTSLAIITLSVRSILDLCYLAHIGVQTYYFVPTASSYGFMPIAMCLGRFVLHNYVDLLAILPVPQVIISIFWHSRSLISMKFLYLTLPQYFPRLIRIHVTSTELNKTPNKETEKWIYLRGLYSFLLYLLAGHVFGALWYVIAIEREASCWNDVCRSENKCEPTTFHCNDHAIRNTTFLDGFCSINRYNETLFDFGMYHDAVDHGVLESTNFPKKLLHCFWWGLQNLSSLGQNLNTSIYGWENIFAVSIAITGLLLVMVYLTSNLKICIQLVTRKSAKTKVTKVLHQMKMKDLEVQTWFSRNDIPKDLRLKIMEYVHKQVEQNKEVHLENILSILPLEQKRLIKRHLCLAMLAKVPILRAMNEEMLVKIFDKLKPVNYSGDTNIIEEGEPLVKMLFITHGTVLTYSTASSAGTSSAGSSTTKWLAIGDFHGEELLNWATTFFDIPTLPISTRTVKSLTKVEAFVLMANDLRVFVYKLLMPFNKEVKMPMHLGANFIQSNWRRHYKRIARGQSFKDRCCRWYSLRELDLLTDGFSDINIIGENCYRGFLPGGSLLAIKILRTNDQAPIEFLREVEATGKVKHGNLVNLKGHCAESCKRILVYEYIDNGNLEEWLKDPRSLRLLTWNIRLKIAMGMANGLAYLYDHLTLKVHCDIELSKVLLDMDWNPKLSNFGLPKHSDGTTRVMRAFGVSERILKEESDHVFDFGILLMEIIIGPRPENLSLVEEVDEVAVTRIGEWYETGLAQRPWEQMAGTSDPRALNLSILSVCLRCIDLNPQNRPNMKQIVKQLQEESSYIPWVTVSRCCSYSLEELETATNGFSEDKVIGEGRYGVVYKGILNSFGVAVKNLLNNEQSNIEFREEVEALGTIMHENLITLIGYCAEGGRRILVHEYVGNGNLEQWLNEDLTWDIRLRIAMGTAKGLAYLYDELDIAVLHCDLKSSKILLDSSWNPKITDFGLAGRLSQLESSSGTTRVLGNFGYVSGENSSSGGIHIRNQESDHVFNFGFLLMEIITGTRPEIQGPTEEDDVVQLTEIVKWFGEWIDGQPWMGPSSDPPLESPRPNLSILHVCLSCVDINVEQRPSVRQIVHLLEEEKYSPPWAQSRTPSPETEIRLEQHTD